MTAPVYPCIGKIRKPIVRDKDGKRQCTKCRRFLPEVAYPRDTPSNLGRDRQCKACHGMKETGEHVDMPDVPLYADPDPNPPPRLVLLGPFAGPIRPTPQPRSKLQHCAYRNHWRPLEDFESMRMGRLVQHAKCVACREYTQKATAQWRARLAEATSN